MKLESDNLVTQLFRRKIYYIYIQQNSFSRISYLNCLIRSALQNIRWIQMIWTWSWMSEYASGCTTEGINKRLKFSYFFAIFDSRGQMKRKVWERRRTKQKVVFNSISNPYFFNAIRPCKLKRGGERQLSTCRSDAPRAFRQKAHKNLIDRPFRMRQRAFYGL